MENSDKFDALLSNHVNVRPSCLVLLDKKGWEIIIEPEPYEEESGSDTYIAFKDGTKIVADNPIELLGLASIHEYHHPHGNESYWWMIKSDDPKFIENLDDDALEKAFFEYKARDYEGWYKCVTKAIKDAEYDPEAPAHERLGIREETFDKVLSDLDETE